MFQEVFEKFHFENCFKIFFGFVLGSFPIFFKMNFFWFCFFFGFFVMHVFCFDLEIDVESLFLYVFLSIKRIRLFFFGIMNLFCIVSREKIPVR